MEDSSSYIPVIDIDSLGLHRTNDDIDKTQLKNVGVLIKDAFIKVGFCYLKNHGIDQDLVDKYMTLSRGFFEQPLEEKAKYVHETEKGFGWIDVEREKLNPERPGDLREAFYYHPAKYPDYWPMTHFKQASEDIFLPFTELSRRVCDALSVGLGLGETFMRDAHKYVGKKENHTTFATFFYPPIQPEFNIKPGQIRLGEHSDYGTVTLLLQDEIGGLEVEIPGKGFVAATPIPGTIVVNIGDLMQRWTADKLVATKHRILIPEVESKKMKPRQSVVLFVQPDNDYVIECLDGSEKYEPISSLNYLNYRLNETL